MRFYLFWLCVFVANPLFAGGAGRILVHIDEKITANAPPSLMAARLLSQRLRDNGFAVYDQEELTKLKANKEIRLFLAGDSLAAAAVDLQLDAEFIIRGKVQVTSGAAIFGGKLRPRVANLGIEIISAKTGKILHSGQYDARYPHIDLVTGAQYAIRQATTESLQPMISVLNPASTRSVWVVIVNEVNFMQIAQLKDHLEAHGWHAELKSFSDQRAQFQVGQKETLIKLAASLQQIDWETHKLEVIGLAGKQLTLEIFEKPFGQF